MEEIVTMLMFELQQNIADNAGTVDYVRYEAKMLSVLQNLQQTPCTSLRGELEQMLSEEMAVYDDKNESHTRKEIATGRYKSLTHVLLMIESRQPVV